jgi:hypothetical protein
MRGMYLNAGATDVGPDPDWDFKTGTWRGFERKELEKQQKEEARRLREDESARK